MMKRYVVFCLWLVLCTVANAQKADVTVLIDSTDVNVVDIGYYSCVHHQKLILHNANGASMASVIIGMDPNTELSRFEYVMTDLDGKVLRTVKKSELRRFEYSSELATDFYRLIAEVTPPTYPVIITRTEKTIRNGNVMTYPAFFPQKTYGMSVDHAVYQIEWPDDKVDVRCKGMNFAASPSVRQSGKKKMLRYTLDGLNPMSRIPFAPNLDELVPYVLFAPEQISYFGTTGSMESWKSFGRWHYGLARGRDYLPEPQQQKIRELTKDCKTEREKIARIYDFLGQTTRYVAMELGIGGYQPALANSVMQMGFGDCKGLSNYMHALLKAVGIESRLVAIGTDEPHLILDFANVNQLNHMILAVMLEQGKDTLWIECTNPKLPVGYVHPGISGHDALWLDQDECRLVTLPEYADSLNLHHANISITLHDDASADVVASEAFFNHRYAEKRFLLNEKEQDQRRDISSWYKLPNTSFGNITIKDACKPFATPQINTHLEGTCAKYANITGRRMFVPVNPLHKDIPPLSTQNSPLSQHLPMMIRHGHRDTDEIKIKLPEGYTIESLPAEVDIDEDFVSFHQKVTQEPNCLRISLTLEMRRGTYPPEARQRLLDMQRTVQKAYNARMVLIRN